MKEYIFSYTLQCGIRLAVFLGILVTCLPMAKVYAFRRTEVVPKPDWTEGGSQLNYPAPRYVLGVGVIKASKDPGRDRLAADQSAFVEIVNQVSADVSSTISIDSVEVQKGKVNSYWERTSSGTKIRSSLSLNGLAIVERHYDAKEKVFYSLGVLDRMVAVDPYLRNLKKIKAEYQGHMDSVCKYDAQGLVRQRILSLRDAYHAACRYQDVLPSLFLLTGPSSLELGVIPDPDSPIPASAIASLTKILAGMRLEIVSGNEQGFIHNKPLNDPLSVRLTTGGGRLLPAAGVQVDFRFQSGNGELLPMTRITGNDGSAFTIVQRVKNMDSESCCILATIYFHDLLDSGVYSGAWNSRIPTTPMSVQFDIKKKMAPAGTEVLVLISNKSPDPAVLAVTRSLLSARLSQMGFMPAANITHASVKMTTLDDSFRQTLPSNIALLIVAEITGETISDAMGMKVCNLSGSVKAMDVKSGKLLAVPSFEQIRGFGVQGRNARADAYKNAGTELADRLLEELLVKFPVPFSE